MLGKMINIFCHILCVLYLLFYFTLYKFYSVYVCVCVCVWTYLYFNFNLFNVCLIHRGYDPSDMELVNTEIRLQISCMK
jgi:hypothetical protein